MLHTLIWCQPYGSKLSLRDRFKAVMLVIRCCMETTMVVKGPLILMRLSYPALLSLVLFHFFYNQYVHLLVLVLIKSAHAFVIFMNWYLTLIICCWITKTCELVKRTFVSSSSERTLRDDEVDVVDLREKLCKTVYTPTTALDSRQRMDMGRIPPSRSKMICRGLSLFAVLILF